MPAKEDLYYRQDVEKFSRLLKTDERWARIRQAFQQDGFDLSRVLLASFYESEEGDEHGVLVTLSRRVLAFVRQPFGVTHGEGSGFNYRDLSFSPEELEQYPEAKAALAMIDEGYLGGLA